MSAGNDQKGSDKDRRAERLAEALRANLRRRKAQARSRRGGSGIGDPDRDRGPDDDADDEPNHGQARGRQDKTNN